MTTKLFNHPDVSWLSGQRPFKFFGPCSAESPEQLRQTASGIKEHFTDVVLR